MGSLYLNMHLAKPYMLAEMLLRQQMRSSCSCNTAHADVFVTPFPESLPKSRRSSISGGAVITVNNLDFSDLRS